MMPIIEELRAEGYTSIRKLMEALNARQVATATESGRWHIRNVELLLKRMEGLKLGLHEDTQPVSKLDFVHYFHTARHTRRKFSPRMPRMVDSG